MAAKARVKVADTASVGEVITIRTLLNHRMESGHRRDRDGKLIERHIVNRFSAAFNGQVFFSVDIDPGLSANPYLEFSAKVSEAGTFTFTWTDDAGEVVRHEQDIAVAR